MLPRLDGLALIDRIRARGVSTPVLILSARRTVDDRVKGLQAGGDDYLTKPFAFAELLARRPGAHPASHAASRADAAVAGRPVARPARRGESTRAGKPIDLRPREFALLEYLMRNPGRVSRRR